MVKNLNEDYLLSYVIGARRRCKVLHTLSKGDFTAIEIAEITFIRYGYVLIKLQELMDKGLITHNGAARSRIYSITQLGLDVMQLIYDHYGKSMKVYDAE